MALSRGYYPRRSQYRRLGESQSRSGCCREKKNSFVLLESNPESPIVQPVASPTFWLDYLALCVCMCCLSIYSNTLNDPDLNLPKKNKTGHVCINVKLRRLHLTTVAVDKQYYIF
jgi:hypothetical protein